MALQPLARLTTPTKLILRELVAANRGIWTKEMAKATDLSWYTADTVLKRLEHAGWLTSEREDPAVAQENARGVRRYWQLTDEGRQAAQDLLQAGRVIQPRSSGMSLD